MVEDDPPFFAMATKDMDIAAPCPNPSQKRKLNLATHGHPEILILLQERNGMADQRMGELLQSIFRFARFRSSGSHPHDA